MISPAIGLPFLVLCFLLGHGIARGITQDTKKPKPSGLQIPMIKRNVREELLTINEARSLPLLINTPANVDQEKLTEIKRVFSQSDKDEATTEYVRAMFDQMIYTTKSNLPQTKSEWDKFMKDYTKETKRLEKRKQHV